MLFRSDAARTILRFDLAKLHWTVADWDRLADPSPYRQPSAFAITARGPSVSSAVLAAAQPVRLDWLAFLVSEETRKRAAHWTSLSQEVRAALAVLWSPGDGLSKLRTTDPAAFHAALAQAGLEAAPVYDQTDLIELLAHAYARDVGPDPAVAELGVDKATLLGRLVDVPADSRRLMLQIAQGAAPRAALERGFSGVAAHLLGQAAPQSRESLGLSSLGRPAANGAQPFELEMTPEKSSYRRDDAASLIVRSQTDCHLTLVSVSPSGRAVVLLPNDWDRSTFLPAGKEQKFPRDDSPFRLRLDAAGWETIVAGCHPATPTFDGIVHDFNLEKFTSLGDYRRFLMRVSDGIPMLTPPTPQGERKAAPRRPSRGAKGDVEHGKPDPAARTAIRFEVIAP
mgnify:CR=1 FL=1